MLPIHLTHEITFSNVNSTKSLLLCNGTVHGTRDLELLCTNLPDPSTPQANQVVLGYAWFHRWCAHLVTKRTFKKKN